jgi:two-component system, NarL family, response regulator
MTTAAAVAMIRQAAGMSDPDLTCVVADDHPSVLRTVSDLIRSWGWTVVATASGGDEAVEQIEEHQPSVAVLDVHMRGTSGLEAATRLARTAPGTAVVFYSGSTDAATVQEALDVGAKAFVVKEAALDELRRALDAVVRGERYVDPLVSGALLSDSGDPTLTKREREILRLLADGYSYDQVAKELFISPETVRTHVGNAVQKLGVRTRMQAVATALRRGLIS